MIQTVKAQKQVIVLAVYTFKNRPARICFTVRSSNGTGIYHTCFDNDHSSCTCDGNAKFHKNCYHIDQLREQAAVYFQSRKLTRLARAAYTALYDPCEVA